MELKANNPKVIAETFYRELDDISKWTRVELLKMLVHDLRHSFATMATTIGEDIRALKDVLGHTKITTTEIYAHTTNAKAKKTANNIANAILGQSWTI